ncbi:MAG: 23S rRNA (adenine(2503)-C(2))-methyltransferase RlmN [Planctomycetia bacterium]
MDAAGPGGAPAPAAAPRQALAGLALEALEALLAGEGAQRWRADQLWRALWQQGAAGWEAVHVLPGALRQRLAAQLDFAATTVVERQDAADVTTKWLLGLHDGKRIETVLIPDDGRATVCVSTQVGCPIGCTFCASGVAGVLRNLSVAEVAEQVLHVQRHLGRRPSHIVVMGMGEPLLNLEALAPAIRLWTDARGMGFSPRRITVSTAATPAGIDRLAAEGLGVQLAVSLHGPDDAVRRRLVPGSPEGRVRGLVDAAARYARSTGRDATAEYVLIAGQNDAPAHAEALAEALHGRHVHVNLIPLNPVAHRPDLQAPAPQVARAFVEVLRARGVSATLRTRRGDDIAAACGQLALERALGGSPR